MAVVAVMSAASRAWATPFDDCAALLASKSGTREAAACFYGAADGSGEWSAASQQLLAASQVHPDSGWIRFFLAEVTARTSSAEALTHYRSAAQSFQRQSDATGEAHARAGLGLALFRSGEGQAGARESESAVGIARRSGDDQLLARTLMDWAWILLQRSERLAGALSALREAESLVFPGGPYALRMRVLQRLGGTLFALGRYEHARARYAALIDLARANDDLSTEALAHFNLLTTRRRQMETLPDRSLLNEFVEDARRGLALAQASGQVVRRASAHRALGDLLASTRAHDEAAEHYVAAVSYARQANDAGELSEALWALGRSLASTQPVASKRFVDEALRVAVDSGRPAAAAYAWRQRMRLAWKTLPRDEAVSESRRALEAIETIRELQAAEGARAGVFSPWTLDYYWLVGTVLAQGAPARSDLALAFDLVERMRARLLLEALRRDARAPDEQPALVGRRRELLRAMSDTQRRLLDPRLDRSSRSTLAAELERLEHEEETLRMELFARRDRAGAAGTILSLDEVERALGPDEAIVSFSVGIDENFYGEFGGGAWIFVVSRAGTRVLPAPDRVKLHASVSVFRGLAEHALEIEPRASVALYDWLLRDALGGLPPTVKRLIIAPDGPLHHVPFAALRGATGAPTLGETHEIVTVPSATVWLRLKGRRPAHPASSALVLADPLVAETLRSNEAAEERGWWPAALRLGALPFARAEGRAVLNRVGGDGRLLLGRDASEPAFKDADPRSYGLVHFAAHALVDDEYPERSAIFVATGPEGDDGLLQVREIAGLTLNGHIVVLSACRSATGAVLAGEGVMGLSRAFLQAGAATVIGTLWAIRDDHAARFFDWFYTSLGEGRTVGTALADARRLAIANGMPAYAWSSIVAIGDDRTALGVRTAARSSRSTALVVGLGSLLLALLAWMKRERWFIRRRPSQPIAR
jgi:CHAT domain-containing protein/tetratricopeptide (TPR) repeat protein